MQERQEIRTKGIGNDCRTLPAPYPSIETGETLLSDIPHVIEGLLRSQIIKNLEEDVYTSFYTGVLESKTIMKRVVNIKQETRVPDSEFTH